MASKPIFVATHPRSCSTAFERVFMTRTDTLKCVHEPFGDAFYYGPERLSGRYEGDEQARLASGFSQSTYKSVLDSIDEQEEEGKRIFIKDMAHYLCPPDGSASAAASLRRVKRGVGTGNPVNGTHGMPAVRNGFLNGDNKQSKKPQTHANEAGLDNPTVLPDEMLRKFHFVFLIRHPRQSLPSYYRCTIPPLVGITGFSTFMPSEAGYRELRQIFDYLRSTGQIGPAIAGGSNEKSYAAGEAEICVIDADDLLNNPTGIIQAFCSSVGLDYDPSMLKWDTPEHQEYARSAFAKWHGFHEDALASTELKPRTHAKKVKPREQEYADWVEKYGEEAAEILRKTVKATVEDYNYLKQFALSPSG